MRPTKLLCISSCITAPKNMHMHSLSRYTFHPIHTHSSWAVTNSSIEVLTFLKVSFPTMPKSHNLHQDTTYLIGNHLVLIAQISGAICGKVFPANRLNSSLPIFFLYHTFFLWPNNFYGRVENHPQQNYYNRQSQFI
jgi:hypothetical protein